MSIRDRALPLSVELAEWMRAESASLGDTPRRTRSPGDCRRSRPRIRGERFGDGPADRASADCAAGLRTALAQREVDQRLRISRCESAVSSPRAWRSRSRTRRPAELVPPRNPRWEPSRASVRQAESRAGGTGKGGVLRISVELLDRLMTLTGELTLIRNQSLLAFDPDDGLLRADRAAARRGHVLRSRKRSCGPGCSRSGTCSGNSRGWFAISAGQLGKEVEMTVVGRDVELDKTILEQLSDPLTGLVRNGVDHGIESPRDGLRRQARGRANHADGRP